MANALDVAMIDVGGTLWPNSWPVRETDGDGRRDRVAAAMPMLEPLAVDELVADLIEHSRFGDEARAISTETPTTIVPADVLIAGSLARQGFPPMSRPSAGSGAQWLCRSRTG